jgi:hypothetical protein
MRKLKGTYTTATEVVGAEEPVPDIPGSFDDDILRTLRDMRDILSKIAEKLETVTKER